MEAILILIFLVVWFGLHLVPIARILRRLGFSGWLAPIALIPVGSLFGLWALAFSEWPALRPPSPRQLDQWSDSDNELFKKMLRERGL